jgi:DNA polymerase III subunit delta
VKLDARRLPAFLRDPGSCRVVLLHGEDPGLIRERAEILVRQVAGSLDDPFRVAELDRDDVAHLPDEAASLSLMGGRRVVRMRETPEVAANAVEAVLNGKGDALLVLEAGALPPRSRLRAVVEKAPDAAAIGCYPEEGRALEETIRAALQAEGITADSEALAWLAGRLGADRASTRAEIEKLGLYVGRGGRVDMEAAAACVGDVAGLSLEDALFAATVGDVAMTDRALEMAIAEGATPVGVVRAMLGHLHRLHRARLAVDGGASPAEAAKSARPPVFFRRVNAFVRALALWPAPALAAAMVALADAERACKRTGAPDGAICRHAVLTVARRAAQAASPGASRGSRI